MQPSPRRPRLCPRKSPTPALTDLSEADLVAQCRRGRRAAQYELYRRYSRAMFGTCLRMCRSREDAEDCLQHAFSDVFRKLDGFRGEATVGAWIKRVVVNTCLTHLKKRPPYIVPIEDHHRERDADATFGRDASPAFAKTEPTAAETERSVARVKSAVATLPDGFRTVLTLYLFEGFDHAEIAGVLGISEQTSKSQYSRARKRLRERLAQTAPL